MRFKRVTASILAGAMALSVALTGCGSKVNGEAVGATLNGKEISVGLMNFMARYQQAINDATYAMYMGGQISLDMYKQQVTQEEKKDDGTVIPAKTMEESIKESLVDNIKTMYLLEEHMADYKVEITEEELTAMDEAAKKFMKDNSKKAIKQLGATEEYVREMMRLYTIQYKMQEAIYDATDVTVTDEEAKQRTFSYVQVSTKSGKDDNGNSVTYTDEQKEALKTEMEELAKAAKTDFDAAIKDHGDTVSTNSYGSDGSSLGEEVTKAADALKEGEISDLITTENYYYIIRLDSEFDKDATEKKKESMINQKKADAYKELCDGYKEAATFELKEEEWAKVKFDRLFSIKQEETGK